MERRGHMTGSFNYRIESGDSLSKIFLREAQKDGFTGTVKNWNEVLSVFEEINEELKEDEKLYSGGSEAKDWHKNFVIKAGDVIKLTKEQLKKIYEAMGFEKEKPEDPGNISGQYGTSSADGGENANNDSAVLTGNDDTDDTGSSDAGTIIRSIANPQNYVQSLKTTFENEKIEYKDVGKSIKEIPDDMLAQFITEYGSDALREGIEKLPDNDNQLSAIHIVLGKLIERAGELGIEVDDDKMNSWLLKKEELYENINALLTQIRQKEIEQADTVYSVQNVFNQAANVVSDFISGTSPSKVKEYRTDTNNKFVVVSFEDGRYIKFFYDKNDKIEKIDISYEKYKSSGSKIDKPEIQLKENGAYYINSKHKIRNKNKLTEGYDFTKLQEFFQPIIDKAIKTEE